MASKMRTGAIILCGGKSSRMGRDKAMLPFGPERILQRVVRLIGKVVPEENTVVVAARGQSLPKLPQNVVVAHDLENFRGPLAGLAIGLRVLAAANSVDAVYGSSCDVPLLVPAFVERMFDLLGGYDAAVPVDGQHHHSLAAVYRPCVLGSIEELLTAGESRSRFLFNEIRAREVPMDMLREVDPELRSLENLNCEEDYLSALNTAGYPITPGS
jgi:molybdenum cofactor guanylyltransferase